MTQYPETESRSSRAGFLGTLSGVNDGDSGEQNSLSRVESLGKIVIWRRGNSANAGRRTRPMNMTLLQEPPNTWVKAIEHEVGSQTIQPFLKVD